MHFCYFIIISPWKRVWPFIWTKLNPLYPRILCAKFGWNWSSSSAEEEENVKNLRRQQQPRRTTDKMWSEKLAHLSRMQTTLRIKTSSYPWLLTLWFEHFLHTGHHVLHHYWELSDKGVKRHWAENTLHTVGSKTIYAPSFLKEESGFHRTQVIHKKNKCNLYRSLKKLSNFCNI